MRYVAFEVASEVNALTKAFKLLNIFSREKVILRTIKKTLVHSVTGRQLMFIRIKWHSVAFEAAAVFSKGHSPQKK